MARHEFSSSATPCIVDGFVIDAIAHLIVVVATVHIRIFHVTTRGVAGGGGRDMSATRIDFPRIHDQGHGATTTIGADIMYDDGGCVMVGRGGDIGRGLGRRR